ncbi:RagB/SusD family nutrient uptake outer membrane protein [Arundinibacter roseus]|uniref:RagB/SusD family nutrient uptake outer membrane protein n=1 Tax=Arundinibacter roseus TaxID=2070510 RepID=A0A4R4K448_9BACT|nr:RagB/SusD family nutrient uptake outer membrane protein [Arundinibacter roseus]TDB61382.1 RagB/SusD family nutrient uptake outer membrane protein [Arundinibacter roseus]
MKHIVRNKFSLSLIAGMLSLAACTNQLNVEPVNTIDAGAAVATSGDVEALLVGAYDALGTTDVYGGNLQRDAELLGDNGEIFFDGTFVAPDEIFRKSMLVNNSQSSETWLDSYRTINIANNVLANLDVVTSGIRDRVEGEAKFIRGSLFFELVRVYGKAWGDGTPASNPGIPLILTPTTEITEEANVSRNSVAEVYAQAIQDLTDAEAKLPAANGFFATKAAAAGMLSRIYMMQERYADAANAATRVINSGRYSLVAAGDVFDLRVNQNGFNTAEDIFAIQITDQDGVNSLNTFYGAAEFGGRGDILIEDAHLDLYEADDLRGTLFYEGDNGGIYTSKWLNQYGNIKVMRLAEMYLTRAEANFRTNASVGASPAEDINLIRVRAGLAPVSAANLTLAGILSERRLELAFEGHLIHDLKRTKSNVGSLPYNSPKLIFPIPQREMDANANLQQNEGY